jgi:hypothetical protein
LPKYLIYAIPSATFSEIQQRLCTVVVPSLSATIHSLLNHSPIRRLNRTTTYCKSLTPEFSIVNSAEVILIIFDKLLSTSIYLRFLNPECQ